MIIATAGHVDHGKTSLVHALTGVDTDRLAEEKARGLTIDLGFAYTALGEVRAGFVDVPGHHRFLHNMLAGVAGIDLAMLVVAADDGVMPQTREHLAILQLLGIRNAVLVVNKIDRVAPERVEAVRRALLELVSATPFAGAEVVPVSATTGAGLPALRLSLEASAARWRPRATGERFRLAIDRAFVVRGAGLVVTGMIHSGTVAIGDTLNLAPAGGDVRVRGIHAMDESVSAASAGQRAALNITGLEREDLGRGQWLQAPGGPPPVERLDVELTLLADAARPVKQGTPVHFHAATAHRLARLFPIGVRELAPGESGIVAVNLDGPLSVARGDRLIIRDQAAEFTLGGGTVLDPFPPRRGRHSDVRQQTLTALRADDADTALATLLNDRIPVRAREFAWNWSLDDGALAALMQAHKARRVTVHGVNWLVAEQAAREVEQTVLDLLGSWQDANPQQPGLALAQLKEDVRAASGTASVPTVLLDAVIDGLITSKQVTRSGVRLAISGRKVELTPQLQSAWERIEAMLGAGVQPPVVHEIARQLGVNPRSAGESLRALQTAGLVQRVTDNRYFLPTTVATLAAAAESLAASQGGAFSVKDYRDQSGLGRNVAIDVLEYFDALGLTRRRGDERVMQRAAAELFPNR